MDENGLPVRHIVFALLGIALLAGGGYGAVVGLDSLEVCGRSTLVANDLTEPSGQVVQFENVTETQQELARQSIEREPPAVTGAEWPWFESAVVVQYRGTYHEFYTVTTPCPFPPETILFVALLTVLLGVIALVPVSLRLVRSRRSG